MKQKLQSFLQSSLLDNYILGTTTATENLEVEHFINTYPEANAEYERLQNNLEILARANAVEAPKNVLEAVLTNLKTAKEPKIISINSRNRFPWYSIAASVAAFIFGATAFMLYQQNQALDRENQVVVDELFDLRSDIEHNNLKLDDLTRLLLKLNNPDSRKYVLSGNERAKNLKTVAYINPVERTSMIDVVALPQLPEEKCYQIWAEMQDKMVSLGILDESERKLQSIPYIEDALALSITIEPKGGTEEFLDTDNEVAEISLKNN